MPTREIPTHSPAPWSLNESDDLRYYGDGYICELHGVTEADKRLILKAPELLAACRAYVLMCEAGGLMSGLALGMKSLVDHIDGGGE